jgi:hypothetical protein
VRLLVLAVRVEPGRPSRSWLEPVVPMVKAALGRAVLAVP